MSKYYDLYKKKKEHHWGVATASFHKGGTNYRGKKVTDEEAAKMKKMWAEKKTVAEIAKEVGYTEFTVRKHLGTFGKSSKKMTEDEYEQVRLLYKANHNAREIAEQLGRDYSTIYNALKKLELPRRRRKIPDSPIL